MGDKMKYSMVMGGLRALALMPLRVLYGMSNIIRFVLERVLKYRRNVIDENLRSSFPDKGEEEIGAIRHEFYRHLGDVIVESIKLLHVSDRTLSRRIEVKGSELVEDAFVSGSPVILFLAHYGNWEWVPYVSKFFPRGMKATHVYKPLRSKVSDRMFLKIRSRFASEGIPQKEVVRSVLGMKHAGELFIIGFISDHRTNWKGARHHVDFLRHHTPINDIGEGLGNRVGAKYLYLDVSKPRRGHYTFEFKRIEPTEANEDMPYTKEYFRMLERSIERQPAYWLWSHRRWLYD